MAFDKRKGEPGARYTANDPQAVEQKADDGTVIGYTAGAVDIKADDDGIITIRNAAQERVADLWRLPRVTPEPKAKPEAKPDSKVEEK